MIRGEVEKRKQQEDRYTCVGYIVIKEALFTSGNIKWYSFFGKSYSNLYKEPYLKKKSQDIVVRK